LSQAGAPLELEVEGAKDAVVDGVGEEARLRNLAEALHRRRSEIEGQRRQLDEEQRALGARLEDNARARDELRARLDALTTEREQVEAARAAAAAAAAPGPSSRTR
jgi:peptidoglycan hydrolase CwlO-like protein